MDKNQTIKLSSRGISTRVILLKAKKAVGKRAVIFVPGAGHTAKYFLQSLSHQKGWARQFNEKNFDCYIFEYPLVTIKNNTNIDSRLILNLLQTLVKKINKEIILVAHSLGAFYVWKLAELSKKIKTIVAIAPSPPLNIISTPKNITQKNGIFEVVFFNQKLTFDFSAPIKFSQQTILSDFVGNSSQFPKKYLDEYKLSLKPIPSLLIKERIIKPPQDLFLTKIIDFKDKQILIVTGEFDIKHSKKEDAKIVTFFNKNKINNIDHIYLPSAGINGNGHLLFAEKNNKTIFDLTFKYLKSPK